MVRCMGKEFNYFGVLIFEGEYLHGERNGKGIEHYCFKHNNKKYEGTFLNGKRNGRGKEFNFFTGNIRFEGEYLNGKEWNGKGYNENNEIDYEVNNGSGFIKKYDNKGILKCKGEYLNGEKNGKVTKYNGNGKLIFEGEYLKGKKMEK